MVEKIGWEKKLLRKTIAEKRKKLSWDEVSLKSKRVGEKFFALPEFEKSQKIMFYLSFNQEVSTEAMVERSIKLKKQVLVPKIQEQDLSIWSISGRDQCVPNQWGIPEPEEKRGAKRFPFWLEIELIVIPGLAFDRLGRRLGFGKGYYDRFLKRFTPDTFTLGLAFDFQVVENIPVTADDFSLDCVVSETKVYRCIV